MSQESKNKSSQKQPAKVTPAKVASKKSAPPKQDKLGCGGKIAMVVISLLFSLVLLEVAARVMHLGTGGFWEPHAEYGWRNIPNAKGWESCYGECEVRVEINSQGLRDEEITYEKTSAETTRILFLGDSMTAAMQVPLEDTFIKVADSGLNAAGGDWETVNGGINGFGTDNELIWYRNEGNKYNADVVVLAMYLANDIYNNSYELETRLGGQGHKPYFLLEGDELTLNNYPVEGVDTLSNKVVTLSKRYFQLPRFIAQTLNLRQGVPDVLKPLVALAGGRVVDNDNDDKGQSGQGQGNNAQQTPPADRDPADRPPEKRKMDICQDAYHPNIEDAWNVTKAIVQQLRTEVEADGAQLLVVTIPASPQITPPEEGKDWYCPQPDAELAAFLAEEGIPLLSLIEPYRDHLLADGEPLYYEIDFHINAAGHRIAGEALTPFIEENVAK